MAKKKSTKKTKSKNTSSESLFSVVMRSFVGKLLILVMVSSLVVLAAIVISGNDFDLFFKITGIAILIITICSWIIYLIPKNK